MCEGPIVSCKDTSHSSLSEHDSCVPNVKMSGTCFIPIGRTKSFSSLKYHGNDNQIKFL